MKPDEVPMEAAEVPETKKRKWGTGRILLWGFVGFVGIFILLPTVISPCGGHGATHTSALERRDRQAEIEHAIQTSNEISLASDQ